MPNHPHTTCRKAAMRLLLITPAVALALTGCSSSEPPENALPSSGATASSSPPTPRSAPVSEAPDALAAVESTLADAEEFAVELEQVFFRTGYPTDLAGALAAAEKTGLRLEPGNTIAAYTYDPHTAEFRLCVENTSGAYATYDTRPMSMRDSGPTGGCP